MDIRQTSTMKIIRHQQMVCTKSKWNARERFRSSKINCLIQGSLVGGSGLNTTSAALEEYVDILSVQQLLLDTPTTSTLTSGLGTSAIGGVQKPRPRLNVQKAVEYSSSASIGNHSGIGEFASYELATRPNYVHVILCCDYLYIPVC